MTNNKYKQHQKVKIIKGKWRGNIGWISNVPPTSVPHLLLKTTWSKQIVTVKVNKEEIHLYT